MRRDLPNSGSISFFFILYFSFNLRNSLISDKLLGSGQKARSNSSLLTAFSPYTPCFIVFTPCQEITTPCFFRFTPCQITADDLSLIVFFCKDTINANSKQVSIFTIYKFDMAILWQYTRNAWPQSAIRHCLGAEICHERISCKRIAEHHLLYAMSTHDAARIDNLHTVVKHKKTNCSSL